MKTIAWTPSPSLNTADYAIDDEVIFSAISVKQEKRLPLLSALLVAGSYAGLNLPFELRNKGQEVLAIFEPGQPIQGYTTVVQALLAVAAHMDNHAQRAVHRTVNKLKQETVNLYERGVTDGIEAERRRVAESEEEAVNEAARRAEAERETTEFAALSAEAPESTSEPTSAESPPT